MKTKIERIFFQIFSSHGKISSKRVFGGIGYVWSMTLISMGMYDSTVLTALGISASMIGLETIATFFNKNNTQLPVVDYTNNSGQPQTSNKSTKKPLVTDSPVDNSNQTQDVGI